MTSERVTISVRGRVIAFAPIGKAIQYLRVNPAAVISKVRTS